MLSITLGVIFGLLFFTYKPLFRNLKESKFQYKAFMELIKHEERKKEFKTFARFQLDKVKVCIQKFLDFISSKEKQAQPLAKEENTQTSAENAESSVSIQKTEQAKEQVAEQTQIETKEAESKDSKDSLNAFQDEKDTQSVENTQNVNESKNKE